MSAPLFERPRPLQDLVAVQEGAVVSRSLIQTEAGSVTLFAFAAGEALSEHTAPYDALILLLEGEAEVTLDGVPHRMTAGEAFLLPAGRPHALRAVSAFKMLLVMIRQG